MAGPDGRADGQARQRRARQVDPAQTTKVVEFNDVEALAAALAPRDVAASSWSRG